MRDIQTAIVECMDATLAELKRSNAAVSDFVSAKLDVMLIVSLLSGG